MVTVVFGGEDPPEVIRVMDITAFMRLTTGCHLSEEERGWPNNVAADD